MNGDSAVQFDLVEFFRFDDMFSRYVASDDTSTGYVAVFRFWRHIPSDVSLPGARVAQGLFIVLCQPGVVPDIRRICLFVPLLFDLFAAFLFVEFVP